MDLNKNFNNIKLYSFNKQDLIILLSVYNAAYLLFSGIIKGHLIVCFAIAVLLSLMVLFTIAWIDLVQKTNEEEDKLEHEQKLIRKNIRAEYLKIHKVKQKNELLMKAGCLSPEKSEDTIVVDHDAHILSLNKDFGEVNEVHFNYIDRIVSRKNNTGQPEGI
jgi:hypothetical protein